MSYNQKHWLTIEDLKKEYGISRSTQAKMRMEKKLPYSKVGKYVRYNRDEIDKMFADAKVC